MTPTTPTTKRWFTLRRIESDSSQLSYEEGAGTVLNKSTARTFEFQIHECDAQGYRGLCGQFAETDKGFADAAATFADLLRDYKILAPPTCVLTGADGENPDDCTTHEHE